MKYLANKIEQNTCVNFSLSSVLVFATLWTVAHQAPLCMGFPKQEYWSGLPFPPPGDLPNPETEATSLTLAGRFFTIEPTGKPMCVWCMHVCVYIFFGYAVCLMGSWFPIQGHSSEIMGS